MFIVLHTALQDGIWVTSSDYKNAQPDPLRDSAHNFVTEINTNNMEDITRFCNVYVDLDFLVCYYLPVCRYCMHPLYIVKLLLEQKQIPDVDT